MRYASHSVWLFLIVLPAAGGCATAGSLGGSEHSKVYGGTRLDATMISEGLSPDSAIAKSRDIERPVAVWSALCGAVDMPLSLVADTVLLPITVPLAMSNPKDDAVPTGDKTEPSNRDSQDPAMHGR